jgi:hypothetical protein
VHNGGMGLFTQQPEDPTEWAGLPAEPLRPRTDAELLPDGPAPAIGDIDLFGDGSTQTVSWVGVPVEPTPETADNGDGDGDGD